MRNFHILALILLVTVLGGAGCVGTTNDATPRIGSTRQCDEPENPYSPGSGHYAGYKWGASGKECGGNSQSFIEGCEEYERQEAAYYSCAK